MTFWDEKERFDRAEICLKARVIGLPGKGRPELAEKANELLGILNRVGLNASLELYADIQKFIIMTATYFPQSAVGHQTGGRLFSFAA